MDVYIYCADIYCEDCALQIKRDLKRELPKHEWQALRAEGDSDSWPQGPYPDGGGEADCPQHCGGCGVFLENELTSDGVDYVVEQLADDHGDNEVEAQWREFYAL